MATGSITKSFTASKISKGMLQSPTSLSFGRRNSDANGLPPKSTRCSERLTSLFAIDAPRGRPVDRLLQARGHHLSGSRTLRVELLVLFSLRQPPDVLRGRYSSEIGGNIHSKA